MDFTRREALKAAAVLVADGWMLRSGSALDSRGGVGRKLILVTCGGMRREDTFSESGFENIPHLVRELLPQSVFFPFVRNAGVTSHYNTISSILTGNWQRLDDWGKTPPSSATIFEFLRKRMGWASDQTWLISSNKALTNQIGASSIREFGPDYGANVVFPKQMIINAVVRAATQGHPVNSADRSAFQSQIEEMLNRDNYDGLGWSISGDSSSLDLKTLGTVQQAIENLVLTNATVTGDEFTFLVSVEVMRRFAPALLVITFSDMEVAHFGSLSLHLAGIRTADRLVNELWETVQTLSAYKDKTTLIVLPEFGRDIDGSVTNGFFNHRQGSDSTRLTWMLCLGEAVRSPQIIKTPIEQIDICPTISTLFDIKMPDLLGKPVRGLFV